MRGEAGVAEIFAILMRELEGTTVLLDVERIGEIGEGCRTGRAGKVSVHGPVMTAKEGAGFGQQQKANNILDIEALSVCLSPQF